MLGPHRKNKQSLELAFVAGAFATFLRELLEQCGRGGETGEQR
jgi:hypothetical protein